MNKTLSCLSCLGRKLPSRRLYPLLLALLICFGCKRSQESATERRSAYYWSTTFKMSDAKRQFIADHHITRLYVRYFDVVVGEDGTPQPNATIRFNDTVPSGVEVIPVVYILNECMARDYGDMPQKLVKRILQMNETHDIGAVREIQIDCDWTRKTEEKFFTFLKEVRRELEQQGGGQAQGITLSATIRLHQLAGKVPPVDRGVLMMYNTGDLTQLDCEHPILDMKDAKPYLPYLSDYDLPLSAAYPLYRWELVFRGKHFIGIQHGDDLPTMPGDSTVVREPTLAEILDARHQLDDIRPGINDEVILYELNDYNITRFNSDDYEKIMAH